MKPREVEEGKVELREGVVYGKGGERDLTLDLFLPKEEGKDRPAVLFIHGGGWRSGNKGQFYRQSSYLASKGYVCACMEYRLSDEAKFPAAVEDAKCAVRWLRANADGLGIDPDKIAASGGSAGGHLALMLGTTAGVADLEGSGGNPGVSSRVNLVIGFNPVADLTNMGKRRKGGGAVGLFLGGAPDEIPDVYEKASPITYLDESDPPALLLHGTADQTVPFRQSVTFVDRMRELGIEAELFSAEGAGHGFFNGAPWYQPTLERMEQFLDKHFRPDA